MPNGIQKYIQKIFFPHNTPLHNIQLFEMKIFVQWETVRNISFYNSPSSMYICA